jgi:hypothetical protein
MEWDCCPVREASLSSPRKARLRAGKQSFRMRSLILDIIESEKINRRRQYFCDHLHGRIKCFRSKTLLAPLTVFIGSRFWKEMEYYE